MISEALIDKLVEEYCTNDLNIKDCGLEYCDKEECKKCWVESLYRLEKHR